MDVQSMSPERSRELADLRRRAYGPAADIARDPAAMARLHELEDQLREEEPANAVPQEPAVREPVPSPAEVPAQTVAADDEEEAAAEAIPDARRPAPATRSWWKRVPIWAIAVASAAVGALIALSAVNLAQNQPDATLAPATQPPQTREDWEDQVRGWDLDPSTTEYFGDFREIDVWQVRSRIGAPCVMLSSRGRPFAIGCASQDLDPIVDFTVRGGMLGIMNSDLVDGMLLRFVARGDRVDVWVREAPPAETQAFDSSWAEAAPSRR